MTKKIISILISLLFAPIFANAYYSAEQFRVDIMNTIRSDAQRQELEDLKNKSNSDIKQAFDTYNSNTSAAQNEYEYKMKELELKEAATDREKSWQKEKMLLDQEMELSKQRRELEEQKKVFEQEKRNKDATDYLNNVLKEQEKNKEVEKTTVRRVNPVQRSNTSTTTKKVIPGSFFDEYTSTMGTGTPVVTNQQQKSVFNKLKDRFFRFF